jgi:hypothetical protein
MDAAQLSPRQKVDLVFYNPMNPFPLVAATVSADISQVENRFPGCGQGVAGYGKRFGAGYIDGADRKLWGNAIPPVMLRQDPSYVHKGIGSISSRLLYSVSTDRRPPCCRNEPVVSGF